MDDHVADEEEEVLLEGVDAEIDAEEIGHQDLSVGVVCKNYEEPGPRGSAADFFIPPLANLTKQSSESIMRSLSSSIDQIHPSQCIHAIDTAGQACLVTYMYGAA